MRLKRRPNQKRFDDLARGVAQGLSIRAAGLAAGYSARSHWVYDLTRRPEFDERVAVFRRELELATGDLAPVILALFDAAEAAMQVAAKEGSGSALGAAARMLAEAGRLKQTRPSSASLAEDAAAKAWLETYGPED